MPLPRLAVAIGVAAFLATGYSATLAPPAGSPSTVAGTAGADGSSAWVKISGGTAGATYPWQVHVGVCGSRGPIFGAAPGEFAGRIASRTIPQTFKSITVAPDGTGEASAKLNMAIPDTGSYYVVVEAAPSDMQTVVSCGNLSPARP